MVKPIRLHDYQDYSNNIPNSLMPILIKVKKEENNRDLTSGEYDKRNLAVRIKEIAQNKNIEPNIIILSSINELYNQTVPFGEFSEHIESLRSLNRLILGLLNQKEQTKSKNDKIKIQLIRMKGISMEENNDDDDYFI